MANLPYGQTRPRPRSLLDTGTSITIPSRLQPSRTNTSPDLSSALTICRLIPSPILYRRHVYVLYPCPVCQVTYVFHRCPHLLAQPKKRSIPRSQSSQSRCFKTSPLPRALSCQPYLSGDGYEELLACPEARLRIYRGLPDMARLAVRRLLIFQKYALAKISYFHPTMGTDIHVGWVQY